MSLKVIPITSITVREDRQRRLFPAQEMEELKMSILGDSGLMTPILVHPLSDDTYELIAGERRLRTLTELKHGYMFGDQEIAPGFVPAVVRTIADEMTRFEAELHENIVRLNLTWQEQAAAITRLHKFKLQQNPAHQTGMTAKLIETKSVEGADYARPATYRKVNHALLVDAYLDRPEVATAPTLEAATRVATRIIETEMAEKFAKDLKALEAQVTAAQPAPDLLNMLEAEATAPEPTFAFLQPEAKIGDFYEGDLRTHLPSIPDGSIHVVITDPPYGVGVKDFNNAGNAGSLSDQHKYSEENYKELHEYLVRELDRICASSAHVYIFCDISYFHELSGLFSEQWRVRRVPLVWNGGSLGMLESGDKSGYKRSSEFILFATKGGRAGSFVSSDIISVPASNQKIHAAQKPDALYEYLLKMSGAPGDRILDPFAGSGTIFRAAKKAMMHPIGIELSPEYAVYCQMAQSYSEPTKLHPGSTEDEIPF